MAIPVRKADKPLCPLEFTNSLLGLSDQKSEGKEVLLVKPVVLSPEQITTLNGVSKLFSTSNSVYRVRMSRAASLSTSGGGAMALATAVYPSQFDQYTQLSPLFGECRIRAVRIQLTCFPNPNAATVGTTDYIGGWFAVAFNPGGGAGSFLIISIAAVTRLPGCKVYNPFVTGRVILSHKFPKTTPWSILGGTNSGTDPVGGTAGYFANVALSTLTASRAYLGYLIEAEYEFRNLT